VKRILAALLMAGIVVGAVLVRPVVAVAYAPPYITGASPSPLVAGVAMTISGTNLGSGDSVSFAQGGNPPITRASDFVTVESDGTLSLTTPSVTGQYLMTVIDGYGNASNYLPVVIAPVGTPTQTCQPAPCYQQPPTYYPPTYPYPPYQTAVGITSVTSAAPGALATIYGTGLTAGAVVNVGGLSVGATSVGVNTLTFVVPSLAAGQYQLTVNVGGVVSNPVTLVVSGTSGGQYYCPCPPVSGPPEINSVWLYGHTLVITGGTFVSPTLTITTGDGNVIVSGVVGLVQNSGGEADFTLPIISGENYNVTVVDQGGTTTIMAYI